VANYRGEIFSLPFNMWTFSKLWDISHPSQAKAIIAAQSKSIFGDPKNLEEQAIKLVGLDVYEKLIKGYTEKQWRKSAKELPKEIIKRLPVRFSYDNNYFNDKYQGIPIGGYTKIFDKLLEGIQVLLKTDYLGNREEFDECANSVIYTGAIDAFFNYEFGELEYKTTIFKHKRLEEKNYQGTAMMNYTDVEVPYTRIIEHKHFDLSETMEENISWVSWEYPVAYNKTMEPYYPVNDFLNNKKYELYLEKSKQLKSVFFGGRLAEYKYYDMHQVIESSLKFVSKIPLKNENSTDK
jgi:UDP-galactopyranose mutase